MKTIAVDFDGVIHAYSQGYHTGDIYDAPMPGALEALKELMAEYAVFILTARDTLSVATWLGKRGFVTTHTNPAAPLWETRGILLVTNQKYVAEAYVDDRGIRFENWNQALHDIKRLMR